MASLGLFILAFLACLELQFCNEHLKSLDDDTFEHLTQAATGATTGNWLVLFTQKDCQKCETANVAFKELADRLHRRMNIAVVKEHHQEILLRRFKIKKFPTTYLFAHGFQYRFYGELTVEKLEQFVLGGYRDVPKQAVSPPLSTFDMLTENIVKELKIAVKERNIFSPIFLFLAVLTILMTFSCLLVCCGGRRGHEDVKKED